MPMLAWMANVPPPSPFFGQVWYSLAGGTNPVSVYLFNGEDWDLVGSYDLSGPTFTVQTGGPQSSVASATTTDLSSASLGNEIIVTGTTTITGLGSPTASNVTKALLFTGVLTLTNGSTLQLPAAANITTVAGDVVVMQWNGAAWRALSVQRAKSSASAVYA